MKYPEIKGLSKKLKVLGVDFVSHRLFDGVKLTIVRGDGFHNIVVIQNGYVRGGKRGFLEVSGLNNKEGNEYDCLLSVDELIKVLEDEGVL